MRKSDLRQKAIRRIRKFEITEEELDDLIHIGDYRYDPECVEGEPYATLKYMIELLPERKRHDLMCLMYLGRNLEYYGLCKETIDDFCFYADEKAGKNCSGSTDPEYLAGKVPIARWLRLVKKEIQPDFWYIGTRYDGNVRLREITEDDADFLIRLVSNQMVTRYIPSMIQDRETLISWIRSLSPKDHEYMVLIEETDELIGECSLTVTADHTAEIGFMLLPQFWRRGNGTEVVRELLENAALMQVAEVTATTDIKNTAAIKLLTKMGFQKQNIGWMASLSEDGEEMSQPQTVVRFSRKM